MSLIRCEQCGEAYAFGEQQKGYNVCKTCGKEIVDELKDIKKLLREILEKWKKQGKF